MISLRFANKMTSSANRSKQWISRERDELSKKSKTTFFIIQKCYLFASIKDFRFTSRLSFDSNEYRRDGSTSSESLSNIGVKFEDLVSFEIALSRISTRRKNVAAEKFAAI